MVDFKYGVIGNPISHSASPLIHHYFAQSFGMQLNYGRLHGHGAHFEQQVLDFFNLGGRGLNVTAPFKQRAFALAEVTTPRCQQAGSANTLWVEEGMIHADNTDGIGLIRDLTRYLNPSKKRILILGSGGAARGIISPILEAKPQKLTLAARNQVQAQLIGAKFPELTTSDWQLKDESFDLIINATSIKTQDAFKALPDSLFFSNPRGYDLSYHVDEPTPFIAYLQSKGCSARDGFGLLVEQAAESFFVWHQCLPDTQEVLQKITTP